MLYGHLLLVLYVTFLLWYHIRICLLTYTWYYLICEIPNKEFCLYLIHSKRIIIYLFIIHITELRNIYLDDGRPSMCLCLAMCMCM